MINAAETASGGIRHTPDSHPPICWQILRQIRLLQIPKK
jgi:hypothetical protein